MRRGVTVNDQENVNRLIGRLEGRYAYIPGVGVWLRKAGEALEPFSGTGALLGEYVDMIAEREGISTAEQIMQTWATAQKNVLWLLEHDPRLSKRLEDFPPHRLRHYWCNPLNPGAPSDPTLLKNENSRLLFRAYFPDNPDLLGTFFAQALFPGGKNGGTFPHAREVQERLLLRTVSQATDPDPLYDFLAGSYGELVCRLPKTLWTAWPDKLTPPWALRLTGVRVVFLDGCEKPREFAPEALRRLVMREQADWLGRDGLIYSLPLPEYFVLTGPPVSLEVLSADLRALALEARPLFGDGKGVSGE